MHLLYRITRITHIYVLGVEVVKLTECLPQMLHRIAKSEGRWFLME